MAPASPPQGAPPTGAPPVPQPGPAPAPSAPDPHGLGAAVAGWGNASNKNGRVALGVASVSFDHGEMVELAVQGDIAGFAGVAVLTDRRLLLVNEAAWVPMRESITFGPDLQVSGEADNRSASVTITTPSGVHQVTGCRDVDLAKAMAARLRARAAGI